MTEEQPQNLKIWRKKVYDLIRKEFKFGKEFQTRLSRLLKSIYEHRVSVLSPSQPLTHYIVCPKCQGLKIMYKQGFKRYKAKIRKAGGDAPPVQKMIK